LKHKSVTAFNLKSLVSWEYSGGMVLARLNLRSIRVVVFTSLHTALWVAQILLSALLFLLSYFRLWFNNRCLDLLAEDKPQCTYLLSLLAELWWVASAYIANTLTCW